jgi:polygalacturonase
MLTKSIAKKLVSVICVALIFGACTNETEKEVTDLDWVYEGIEFDMPRVERPEFPDFEVSITEFGAVPGGQAMNTEAIRKAIDKVVENGGGKVVIPRGIWLTGPITLKSNVNLHAEQGALVLFSPDFDLYPLIETSFEGLNTFRCLSPIYAKDAENIAITGKGVFDGSGHAWRPVKKSKLTESEWKKQISSGGVLNERGTTWHPTQQSLDGSKQCKMNVPEEFETIEEHEEIKDFLRPVMLSFVNCNKVLLDGVGFQNSAAWCLHPLMCENVTISNLIVRNPDYSQNGDGLDLESCKNVVIFNCNFDVGDDAICFKSGKNQDGLERGMPNENVIVKNCIVYHGHGGFVIGSEMSGGMRNIHISNCTFMGTDIGLRFKSTRGRGGVIEKIYISNIDMIDIPAEAIRFNMFYGGNSPIPEPGQTVVNKEELAKYVPPVTVETPVFRDIYITNVVCRGARRAIELEGLPEMNLKNVVLKNINIIADRGMDASDVNGIEIENLVLKVKEGPVISLRNAQNVNVTQFDFESSADEIVTVEGINSGSITFNKEDFGNIEQQIVIQKGLDKNVVSVK